MNRTQILNLFHTLARSQGFYGRLLRDMHENPDYAEDIFLYLEGKNCKTDLDVILAMEE